MVKIRFETGQVVNFDGNPTQSDIDEVAKSFSNQQQPNQEEIYKERGYGKTLSEGATLPEIFMGGLKKGAKELHTEVAGPVAHGLSNFAFGIPKTLAARDKSEAGKATYDAMYPEQETGSGKLLRFGAEAVGYIGGGAGKVGLEVGKKLLPKVTSKILMSDKGIPKVIGDTMLRKAGRGAITGATAGATQLSPNEEGNVDLGRQAGQAGVAAVLGGIAEPTIGFISKAGKAYKRWKRGAKISAADKVKGNIAKDQQAVTLNTAERNAAQRASNEEFAVNLEQSRKLNDENFSNLLDEYQKVAEIGAVPNQDGLRFVSGEMTESFGGQLAGIADDLVASGQPITRNELAGLFSNIRDSLDENLITSGYVSNLVNNFESKYAPKMIGKQSRFTNTLTGEKAGTLKSNADEVVDFKEFVKDLSEIKKGIKYGGKTEDNVALGIFYDDLTGYLGQRSGMEKYLQLKETYTPYIQALKTVMLKARAYAGESNTQASTNFLKRFGLRKAGVLPGNTKGIGTSAEISEVNSMELLQNPSPFSKGMGTGMTNPVVAKAQQLAEAKQQIDDITIFFNNQKRVASNKIDNSFNKELDNIMGSNKYIESDYTLKAAMVDDALKKKLARMGYQEDKIDVLLRDRKRVPELIKKIAIGTAGVGGVLATGAAIGRATRGQ